VRIVDIDKTIKQVKYADDEAYTGFESRVTRRHNSLILEVDEERSSLHDSRLYCHNTHTVDLVQ